MSVLIDGGRKVPDMSPLLPALLPELVRRYGQLPVQETAEEIRLQIVDLTSLVVSRADARGLAAFAPDVCTVMCRALEDGYHDIKKAACSCLASLAARAPPGALDAHAEKLLAGLAANLQHPHSRVRLAVIQALDALLVAGVPPALVASVVAPGVKPAAYDRAPAVREALFTAVAHWLGYREEAAADAAGAEAEPGPASTSGAPALAVAEAVVATQQQCSQHAAALLPLLLVGVTDPQEATAALALRLIEGVGRLWQAGSCGTTAAATAMDMDGAAAGTPPPATDGDGDVAMASALTTSAAATAAAGGNQAVPGGDVAAAFAACQLGPPYQGRPGPGCRALVSSLLPKLLPPIAKELTEWTVALRVAAARNLHTTLVLAEAAATDHLQQLVPALCSAIGDEDADVAGHVIGSVHALGAYVAAPFLLRLVLDHLSSGRLSLAQKANTLVVLSGLLHAAGRAKQQLPDGLLLQVADCLASDEVRGAADHAAVRQQLLLVAANLMAWAGPRCSRASAQLYLLLLQLYGSDPSAVPGAAAAPADGSQQPQQQPVAAAVGVQAAMAQLAGCCGVPSFDQLAEVHADAVLASALGCCTTPGSGGAAGTFGRPDLSAWTSPDAPPFRVFRALLLTASGPTLERLTPVIASSLKPLLEDHESDGTLRVALLGLVDTLLEDPVRGPALAGAALLRDVLLPPLVWRAGKVSAAVRFAAVTAWSTALERRLLPLEPLLAAVDDGSLLPLLHQAMDEDWYVDMRASTCFVMEQLLQVAGERLSDAARRAIYPELLKRLDDSNNSVRVATCRALVAFVSGPGGAAYCDTNSGYLAAGVIIHMDDSDPRVQDAACSVLEAQAAHKPAVVAAEVNKVRERFRSKHYCDRVAAACEAAAAAAAKAGSSSG